MSVEENIKQQLIGKFPSLNDKIEVKRQRRIFAEVLYADFAEIFDYAIKKLNFSMLSAMTGLDEGTAFGVIYHLSAENGIMLNLHTTVTKDKPEINTITSYFPAADAYERELIDLFGMQVAGLPKGNRYPLPDGWPANQFPLRKDWNAGMLEKKEAK